MTEITSKAPEKLQTVKDEKLSSEVIVQIQNRNIQSGVQIQSNEQEFSPETFDASRKYSKTFFDQLLLKSTANHSDSDLRTTWIQKLVLWFPQAEIEKEYSKWFYKRYIIDWTKMILFNAGVYIVDYSCGSYTQKFISNDIIFYGCFVLLPSSFFIIAIKVSHTERLHVFIHWMSGLVVIMIFTGFIGWLTFPSCN
ncbi:hypothetical protein HK096_010787 [Nowakowskiella sp. JEL0078]|nr:hypothetical protein HK096_010787 [Nowakowskiella sp. JEL0078]